MNRMNKAQKEKIGQFRNITGASEKIAIDCLKQASWGQEAAIEFFYSSGLASTVKMPDSKSLDTIFAKYKDASASDMIMADGMMRMCEDLQVDPADVVMLVISYHMHAATMCEFSKEEFTQGMLKMGVDSIDKLKRKLPELRAELNDEGRFRDVYNYAYMFAREKGQKCVQLDTALGMWQLLLGGDAGGRPAWPLLEDWVAFLQRHHAGRAISKDTWEQLLDFVKTIKPDFSNFDPSGAWPFQIDEFVEHMNEKRAGQ